MEIGRYYIKLPSYKWLLGVLGVALVILILIGVVHISVWLIDSMNAEHQVNSEVKESILSWAHTDDTFIENEYKNITILEVTKEDSIWSNKITWVYKDNITSQRYYITLSGTAYKEAKKVVAGDTLNIAILSNNDISEDFGDYDFSVEFPTQ